MFATNSTMMVASLRLIALGPAGTVPGRVGLGARRLFSGQAGTPPLYFYLMSSSEALR